MKTVLITGITGTLGSALGREYLSRGWRVIGVSRRPFEDDTVCTDHFVCQQQTEIDAQLLLETEPDLIFLNAGQIETETGPLGEPLPQDLESITRINYLFPAHVSLLAAEQTRKPLDIIWIGSVADCSPSVFGPVYHCSKVAAHYFVSGTAPILENANPNLRLRIYRPGAIQGPLSWAPALRLNERGYKIRARRCNKAPAAENVAQHIVRFSETNRTVGSWRDPLSFRFFGEVYAWFPNLFSRMQRYGWKSLSKFVASEESGEQTEQPPNPVTQPSGVRPVQNANSVP